MRTNQPTDSVHECDEILDLIADYAFGLTDVQETRFVEANLQRCPEAAAQLQDYRILQEEMRASVPQVEPPMQVGERLMAALVASAPTLVRTAEKPLEKPRRLLRPAWLIAAAAVLALVVSNAYWFTRVNDLAQRQDELLALINPQDTNAFVLTSTNALHWVRLANDETNSTSAFMMWNGDSETGLLYARGFPELQQSEKYHVWLTRNGERVFVGILQIDDKGDGALLFHSPEAIDSFAWAWVTAQSAPDASDAPTIVSGELS